ncbi:MAG: FAD:protein FMN transferase [Bacteroidetes bacterium]|jgi:thiamine biosynthesis lipoprotein|nr:FAD:protein FMN transferase [Bacteroidota bacterium]
MTHFLLRYTAKPSAALLHLLPILLLLLLAGCAPDGSSSAGNADYSIVEGETMGTYYRITYKDRTGKDLKPTFDSVLRTLNLEVSTYIPQSTISRFNAADSVFDLHTHPVKGADVHYDNTHFLNNYRKSVEVAQATKGYFDPTVMPLVNYWGFGYTEKKMEKVDSSKVDSLLQFVGLDKVELAIYEDSKWLRKALPGVKLDFSAVAKGYGVDLLGQVLQNRDITDYLVDIGGETLAKGESPRGTTWQLGISLPKEEASLRDLQTSVPLQDQALATSGNYRNFYEVDGVKYSHTINPKTGYPERNTLLSASVFAPDCMTADAYATAFMTLGTERAYQLAGELPTVEAYFIFSQPDGSMDVRYTQGLNAIFAGSEKNLQ